MHELICDIIAYYWDMDNISIFTVQKFLVPYQQISSKYMIQ